MGRDARVVVPGFAHHVTQRRNRRADVFYSDDDRRAYLRFLRQDTLRHGLAVWAYYLMTNHVHLVVVPQREDSLAKALCDAHTGGADSSQLLDLKAWRKLTSGSNWKERLTEADDTETVTALRLNTQTGRPLASTSFLSKLERPLPVGRPKIEKTKTKKERNRWLSLVI